MNYPIRSICQIALLALALSRATAGLEANPDRSDATYSVGEKITWLILAKDEPGPVTESVRYKITRDGGQVVREGTADLKDSLGEVSLIPEQAGVLLLELTTGGGEQPKQKAVGGALVDPARIPRSAPRPADFDGFWDHQLAELAKVPMNPQLTPGHSGMEGVSHWLLTMDLPRGAKMQAQLARPEVGGKFPAVIIFQYAGVYPLPPAKVTPQAASGWLALNVSAHDLPLNEPAEFYKNQEATALKNYPGIGSDDREKSYFLRMFLACSRAVDYLASRPDWDGRMLVVSGTSQGGLQAIVAAGLNPKVSALVVNVPAGCDNTAPLAGRAVPWPYWLKQADAPNRDAMIRTCQYFDAQNFAPRVKCPALISFGLLDRTATASGVTVMAGQLAGPLERLLLTRAEHQDKNHTHAPFVTRSNEWMEALKNGGPPQAPAN